MRGRSKHSDKVRFMVAVLFASGASTEAEIAAALRLTRGTVSGLINRSGDGKLRSMTRSERQAFLDRARAQRFDEGALEDRYFTARDIERRRA